MNKNYKFILIPFLATLILGITSCGTWHGTKRQSTTPKEVQILAVNDIHAALDQFPRFAFMVDSIRQIYPNLILLSGGDNQTGNPVNDQYHQKGMPIVMLMNKLGFDLSALGNHEYDVSGAQMAKNFEASDFDYICANAQYKDDSHPLKKNKIITLPNGLKLGFSSLLYINSTGYPDCHPDNTIGFKFLDANLVAQQQIAELRDKVDILIFLNHVGFDEDVKLANLLPKGQVDLIIGGHSHTKIDDEQYHNGTLITQAASKLAYASLIKINVLGNEKQYHYELMPIDSRGSEKVEIRELVDKLTRESGMDTPIAKTEKGIYSKEHLGYMMADSQRAFADADVAIVNPGGVRISKIAAGEITKKDIYTLDPFGNEIILFEMTGKELQEMLTNAIALDGHSPLIPSGVHLKYIFEKSGEKESLKSIELLTDKGTPLDLEKNYRVVMNNYVATVYSFPKKETGKSLYETTANATIQWLENCGMAPDYSGVKRIEIIK